MVIHGFELIEERQLPEAGSKARLFRHAATGAQLLSLENQDENKVFGITFRTPPPNSTGLPHIMEHSVLCGSAKYPVKEPFVELKKGSQATFLNAFTYPDKTCYPVASQNLQDFYNLVDVYVDAVFHPLITPQTLQQEGWHYELDDPSQPLAYKGVVFNEMKGAYSSPEDVLYRQIQQHLFPDNEYGVDSGGDPRVIPTLTYEQFKHFHETYYHPSNSYIYFYGDDDPDRRLELMDGYLSGYNSISVASGIRLQPAFAEPRRVNEYYAAGDVDDQKSYLTVNWMLGESRDMQHALGLGILDHILLGTPASPLRKALIDSGLGEDLAGFGMETDLRQAAFSTGLKGIQVEHAGQVEALIESTLRSLADDGIDPEMIAASLNTIEFRLRERNTGSFPRGLLFMLIALGTWLHGRNPLEPLAFEAPLASIKAKLAAGQPYFEDLIRTCLLENPHRVILQLEPDPGLGQKMEAAERERLDQARAQMSDADLHRLVELTRSLKERQETPDSPDALASIPSLKLADLDRSIRTIPLEVLSAGGAPTLYHDLFTGGIIYLDLGFNLRTLPQELISYVPLFGRGLLEMGTRSEDYVRLSMRIGKTTGGIRPSHLATIHRTSREPLAWLFLRGKATPEHAANLLSILKDVLLAVNFDNPERFKQMVLEEKANLEAALAPRGHGFVNTRLRACFDAAGWAAEQTGGIEYLYFLRRLADDLSARWSEVLEKLDRIRAILVNRQSMIANVTLDSENWAAFRPQLEAFNAAIPAQPAGDVPWVLPVYPTAEGLTLPAQVNFVGKGASLYDLGYKLHGSMSVISNYIGATWMWEKVRVQGGAYGGFFSFDSRSGVLTYLSYRDPNLLQTLDVYDRTSDFLRTLQLNPAELTRSIVGAIGDLDAYQLPDAKGFTSLVRYLAGDTDEFRQEYRTQLLSTTAQDFYDLARVLDGVRDHGRVVVLGSVEKINEANSSRLGWLDVKKVL